MAPLLDGHQNFLGTGAFSWNIWGVVFGLVIGAIPGLQPVTAVALAIPISFGFDPTIAMVFLIAVYVGSVSGGSVSSILLNIPGTSGSIATCFDGFPLSRQGRAREALGTAMSASAFGALGGAASFILLAPLVGRVGRLLGPAEYSMLMVMAFLLVAAGSKQDTVKGMAMATTGLLLSFVGRDVTTATPRYTQGSIFLEDGVPFVAAVIGLYAMSQVIAFARDGGTIARAGTLGGKTWAGVRNTLRSPFVMLRAWVIGTVVGVLPGIGIALSGMLNWVVQRGVSKDPETYGRGNPRGLVATETGNNATATGSLSTAFGLGIPGGSTDAVLLGGMLLYGLQPGPRFFEAQGGLLFPTLVWAMLFAPLVILATLLFMRYLAYLTIVPHTYIIPVVAILAAVGAFATRSQPFDVLVMFAFGVAGYFLERGNFPLHNLVIGMVLGDLLEQNLNRAIIVGRGTLDLFWDRPIARVLVIVSVATAVTIFVDVRRILARVFPGLDARLRSFGAGAAPDPDGALEPTADRPAGQE